MYCRDLTHSHALSQPFHDPIIQPTSLIAQISQRKSALLQDLPSSVPKPPYQITSIEPRQFTYSNEILNNLPSLSHPHPQTTPPCLRAPKYLLLTSPCQYPINDNKPSSTRIHTRLSDIRFSSHKFHSAVPHLV